MLNSRKRRRYDRAFKLEAIRLVTEEKQRVTEVARQLGIHPNQIHNWKRRFAEEKEYAFLGQGRLTPEQEELRRLQRENADLREERDILKKAMAIFSSRRR
jgi:transposase